LHKSQSRLLWAHAPTGTSSNATSSALMIHLPTPTRNDLEISIGPLQDFEGRGPDRV
jgi:hypothetical protein